MNRRFRLASLERLRAVHLADAARTLGRARQSVADAHIARYSIARQLEACVPARVVDSGQVQVAAARRDVLRDQLVEAEVAIGQAREAAAEALATWNAARAELKAVEALHQRHREALRHEDARREQLQLDELAAVRARRSGSTGYAGSAHE
jgi:flagellar biosynthesis chaperone FliJ